MFLELLCLWVNVFGITVPMSVFRITMPGSEWFWYLFLARLSCFELKLKLYQFVKPTCELEMRSQASCRSLLPEGCVLSISLLRTKPRFGLAARSLNVDVCSVLPSAILGATIFILWSHLWLLWARRICSCNFCAKGFRQFQSVDRNIKACPWCFQGARGVQFFVSIK